MPLEWYFGFRNKLDVEIEIKATIAADHCQWYSIVDAVLPAFVVRYFVGLFLAFWFRGRTTAVCPDKWSFIIVETTFISRLS